jgi:uncharacterized protein YndB with AHSA1/START domain
MNICVSSRKRRSRMASGESPAADEHVVGESTTPKTKFIAEPGVAAVTMTRVFDAPRERVFAAHTDPAKIPRWWGPRRLTTVVETLDARTGGSWRFVQTDIDGTEFSFRGVYHDVAPPERVINTFEYESRPGHVALETLTLEDVDGKTRLTNRYVFQTLEDRDWMTASGMEEGAVDSWERLAELVKNDPAESRRVAALPRSSS